MVAATLCKVGTTVHRLSGNGWTREAWNREPGCCFTYREGAQNGPPPSLLVVEISNPAALEAKMKMENKFLPDLGRNRPNTPIAWENDNPDPPRTPRGEGRQEQP